MRRLLGMAAAIAAATLAHAQTYTITTLAGNGASGYAGDGGAASSAQFFAPTGLAMDTAGNLYIADTGNARIRKIATDGSISTVAGAGGAGMSGDGGPATSAMLSGPRGVFVDSSGNIYIADTANRLVRKVTGTTINTIAGNIYDTNTESYGGDNGPATTAIMAQPVGVVVDSAGNVYISDTSNHRIRKVDTNGVMTTYAGDGTPGFGGDGTRAVTAHLNSPRGLALDAAGNLYIADTASQKIRVVNAATGIITTVAGTGTAGFSGDLGLATKAQLNAPYAVALDAAGNLYIADYSNSRIRKVSKSSGVISTIAGNGRFGHAGDGGPGTSATLNFPGGVAVDANGNVYIADTQSATIRKLTPDAASAVQPKILDGGVIQPAEFGAAKTVAPGSWVEIYGTGLASASRSWSGAFTGVNAPTSLNGTGVIIAGQQAFLAYVSDGQVNAQIPSGVPAGAQSLTVNTAGGASNAITVTVAPASPALYAPAAFKINGKQYAAAVFLDGSTFAIPAGAVSGLASRAAKPGDMLIFFGVGFGAVTPDTPAGQVVQKQNALAAPVQVMFGNTAATVQYQGLATGAIGLYQFNVVVPNVAPGDTAVTFTQSGATIPAGYAAIAQ